jgi:hypothetical protein
MSRNNKDRLGVGDLHSGAEVPPLDYSTPTQAKSAPIEAPRSSSPLSFVSPTEFVELPSGGKFYDQDHPLHGQDVIEIKHMTTKEEDILSSSTLLKQGKALDRLLQQIIVEGGIDSDNLLIGDRNALLVAARKSGYGSLYSTQTPCPSCQENIRYDWDLDEAVKITGAEPDPAVATETNSGTYVIHKLPVTGWDVEVRPLTGKDEKSMMKSAEARKKQNLPEDTLSTQMSLFIVSISGVTDRLQIIEAISKLPARDARYLRGTYKKIMPNIDIRQNFACPNCDYSGDMEVPFTTDFFWPQQ